MQKSLRMGVVGAGVFGGYHAGKLAAHPRVEFMGVYDSSLPRADQLAKTHGGRGYAYLARFLSSVDAVIIASPARTHGPMAIQVLEAGCHCLIEKPVATDLQDCARIAALAETRVVQIGHQERIVARATGLPKYADRIKRITAHRHSPPGVRGTDVSVVEDLLIHDIDLVLWLMGRLPDTLTSETQICHTEHIDEAEAILRFGDRRAYLSGKRTVDTSSRQFDIEFDDSSRLSVDFNAKTLTHDGAFVFNTNFGDDPAVQDSLATATDIFVRSVLDGTPPLVRAAEGMDAVRIAQAIERGRL